MDRKTLAPILTVFTVLFCACPGLASLCFSLLIFDTDPNGFVIDGQIQAWIPPVAGMLLVCAGLIGLLIPIVVGYLMFRKPRVRLTPAELEDSLPPPI